MPGSPGRGAMTHGASPYVGGTNRALMETQRMVPRSLIAAVRRERVCACVCDVCRRCFMQSLKRVPSKKDTAAAGLNHECRTQNPNNSHQMRPLGFQMSICRPVHRSPPEATLFEALLMICAAKPRYTAAAAREHRRVLAPSLLAPLTPVTSQRHTTGEVIFETSQRRVLLVCIKEKVRQVQACSSAVFSHIAASITRSSGRADVDERGSGTPGAPAAGPVSAPVSLRCLCLSLSHELAQVVRLKRYYFSLSLTHELALKEQG